jgi:hypothetical protein
VDRANDIAAADPTALCNIPSLDSAANRFRLAAKLLKRGSAPLRSPPLKQHLDLALVFHDVPPESLTEFDCNLDRGC